MKRTGRIVLIACGAAAIVGLLAGLPLLFGMRFRAGDVYPPYSSLRGDPLGARVLYEAIERTGGHGVQRTFQPPETMEFAPSTTLLYLGDTLPVGEAAVFDRDDAQALLSGIRGGMRVVVTLRPRNRNPGVRSTNTTAKAEAKSLPASEDKEENKPTPKKPADPAEKKREAVSLREWLDIGTADVPLYVESKALLAQASTLRDFPVSLPCETSVVFTNPGPDWTVLYRRSGYPVMVERRIGKGSIVLSSLSFFVSNEGLRKEPHAALIAWILGGSRNVIFDETHLGLVRTPGFAAFLQREGLFGLVAGLLLLALLYVWRQAMPLAPPYVARDASNGSAAPLRDSLSGLASLLTRNIPRDQLVQACVAEWRKTAVRRPAGGDPSSRMASVLDSPSSSPARDYNRLVELMSEAVNPVAALKRRRNDEPRKTEGNSQPRA